MDRLRWFTPFVLCAGLLVSPGAAQPPAPAPSRSMMTSEMLNVQLFNVTPTTAVTLAFQGLRFTGPPRAKPGSEAAVQGVSIQGSTIVFSPPQRSVPIGQFTTVSFFIPIAIIGPVGGTATVHKPVVVTLSTSRGFISTQDGPFTIPASAGVVPAVTPGNP